MDRSDCVAVIGAGPHGLSALKALLQLGIPADGFERASDLGGNWNFGAPTSRVYESTHLISSKPFTQFPDFPMPDDYPDYPSHRQVKAYFDRYADHFGLRERINFNAPVSRIAAVGDQWDVSVGDTTIRYGGVVVANGHNWHPKVPDYPGEFAGEILHSAQYKSAAQLRGKRVLVVGAGNTGCDIAVEAAQNASVTYHSTRRGYYYNPKFVFGKPSDQMGKFESFGLQKPDHAFFETHPIVNQQLVYYVGHGDITPKPDIDHFDAKGAVFTDGTRADVDLVVFATGYLAVFPFLADPEVLDAADGRPRLALQMASPTHPTLWLSGLIQPDSGQWTIAHWQGMAIAEFLRLYRSSPERARRLHTQVNQHRDQRFTGGAHYKDSTRHFYEIAHQDYLEAVQEFIGQVSA
jgi:hypothetical protein